MKKAVLIALVLLIVLNLAAPGYCGNGPIKKLGRGVSNLLTFPLELPHRIIDANKRSGPYEALTYGLWEGAVAMIMRAAMGFFEVISFPVPVPEGYEPVIDDPEFLWDLSEWGK